MADRRAYYRKGRAGIFTGRWRRHWLAGCLMVLIAIPAPNVCRAGIAEEAEELLARGQYLEAVGAYLSLYEAEPQRRAEALEQVADIYNIYLNDPAGAKQYYLRVIKEFASSDYMDDALYNLAIIELNSGRLDGGRSYLEQLVKDHPDSPRSPTAAFFLEKLGRGETIEKPKSPEYPAEEKNIRVLLARGRRQLEIKTAGRFRIVNQASGLVLAERTSGAAFNLSVSTRGTVKLMNRDLGARVVELELEPGRPVTFENADYTGDWQISAGSGGLELLNTVPVETYLLGVVPAEMPASWPMEALKAQAIVARTFALFQMEKRRDAPFDVYATTRSQVYGGRKAGADRAAEAVRATRGDVVTYNDALALTYFHANSGGVVEDDADVWSTNLPYLQRVIDPFSEQAEGVKWSADLDPAVIASRLQLTGRAAGLAVAERSPSGRAKTVILSTAAGSKKISGNRFRLKMDPAKVRSTLFEAATKGGRITLTGKGFGHGVGLSQWGAKGMAEAGYSCQMILQTYYPGTRLKKLYR